MSVLGSEIVTDVLADPPRPRGTPIADPPNIEKVSTQNEEASSSQSSYKRRPKASAKPGCKPQKGFFSKNFPAGGNIAVVNSQHVRFGNTQNIFVGSNGTQQPAETPNLNADVSPPEYEVLMSSTKIVSDNHLNCVAVNIGANWKKLGKLLRLTDADIFRIDKDTREGTYEKIYQVLQQWKQNTGGPNTAPMLSRLSLILWQLREVNALNSLLKMEEDPRLNLK